MYLSISRLNLPEQKVTDSMIQSWPHLANLKIPEVNSKDVTMLLGANLVEAILHHEVRKGARGHPAAVLTASGWTLTGCIRSFVTEEQRRIMHVHHVQTSDDLLQRQMQDWWRTDTFGTNIVKRRRNLEKTKETKILEETVKNLGNRYEVGLLWKDSDVQLPDNRVLAEKRLESTEKRLKRDPAIAEKYKETINGYVQKVYSHDIEAMDFASPQNKLGR